MSLRYHPWTLSWLYTCIRSHAFNSVRLDRFRRLSVGRCDNLISHVHSHVRRGWVELLRMRWTTMPPKIIFTIWPFIYQTISFWWLLEFSRSRNIGSVVLRHSRYFIRNNSIGIRLCGDCRWIFGEGILSLIDATLSRNTNSQLALVRFINERRRLRHLLLLSRIIEIIAGKDVIIINCMI